MKPSHFYIAVALAAACFILSVAFMVLGMQRRGLEADVQRLQGQIQTQQDQINGGTAIGQRIGPSLLKDMAAMSKDNPPMKEILTKHGISLGGSTAPTNP